MGRQRIIIIGAGVGGLAAAVRLAPVADVILLEKNDRAGGKLNHWVAPHPTRSGQRPFRFDTGPSLLTMPFVFMDLFAAAGKDVRDYLRIIKLDPVSRFAWKDGTRFHLAADDAALQAEIRRLWPRDAAGFARFLERGRKVWDLGSDFLSHSPEQLFRDPRGTGLAQSLALLGVPFRIGMFGKLARAIDRDIRDHRLRDVLYQYATYSGASPWQAPATLSVIPWAEHYFGGWHIEGGMYRLAEQLEQLAREFGVEIRTNSPVSRILIDGMRVARGVRLSDGTELPADAVIANCDAVYAYRNLIEPEHRPHYSDHRLNQLDPGGSGMVLMLGVEGTYPQLAHHTKFMPDDYRAELSAMFEKSAIPDDPCIYVCAATRTDESLAPPGCETLFILVSAPSLRGSSIDWLIEGPRYRDRIIMTLEKRWGLNDLSRRIVVQKMLTPADFEQKYNANAGSIYGLASSSLRSAFLRPPNRDRRIERLYFAGSATHPGGGLPLVALSGKIVSELVLNDLK